MSDIAKKNRTLYYVHFVDQLSGATIDEYFLADNIAQIEQNVAEIKRIKVIKEVIEL